MSFWRTYYHVIWATKQRQPVVTPSVEVLLFPYLVHKAAELGVHVYAINGWTDHVHLVVSIPPRLAVAQVVKELKGSSSRYINAQGTPPVAPLTCEHFARQEGYGVLTIGERHRHMAVEYVQRQKEHHAANQTVAALERSEEKDAGPQDYVLGERADPGRLREASAPYTTAALLADEIPF